MKLPSISVIGRLAHLKISSGRHLTPLDPDEHEECQCMNCNTVYKGNYCPNCGQSSSTGRLTIMHAIDNLLGLYINMEKGLLHTCIDLIYRPGYMMRDYIKGHRVEYIKPIQLLFLFATLYLILHYMLFIGVADSSTEKREFSEEEMRELQEIKHEILGENFKASFNKLSDSEAVSDVVEAVESGHERKINLGRDELKEMCPEFYEILKNIFDNKAVVALLMVVLMVFPYKICFRKTPMGQVVNFTECFFMMVYVECQQLMFNIFMLPLERVINHNDEPLTLGVPLFLLIWDSKQFFGVSWWRSVKLNILSIMLAVAILIMGIVLIGLAFAMIDGDV